MCLVIFFENLNEWKLPFQPIQKREEVLCSILLFMFVNSEFSTGWTDFNDIFFIWKLKLPITIWSSYINGIIEKILVLKKDE